jgi:hypothetical protein
MKTLLEEEPSTCADKMKLPIFCLELRRKEIALEEQQFTEQGNIGVAERLAHHGENMERAIALLKGHAGMCECGPMPNDCNAAVWDLSRSLSVHTEMLRAYAGTPKGEYHARAIREIREALRHLERSIKHVSSVGTDPAPEGERKIGYGVFRTCSKCGGQWSPAALGVPEPCPSCEATKEEPVHHWKTEHRCAVCQGVLTWNQVMYSAGLCPLCGFRHADAVTVVEHTRHAYREEPRPWWMFWAPKVRIYKEEK